MERPVQLEVELDLMSKTTGSCSPAENATRLTAVAACETDGPTLSCPVTEDKTVLEASRFPTCRTRQTVFGHVPNSTALKASHTIF